MDRRFTVFGAPCDVGGAGTELWHTLRLWRESGLKPRLVPTTSISPTWKTRCEKNGIPVLEPTTSLHTFLHPPQNEAVATPNLPMSQETRSPSTTERTLEEIVDFLKQTLCDVVVPPHSAPCSHSNSQSKSESKFDSGIAVSFCNGVFLEIAPALRQMGYRLIWVNCMNWLFAREIQFCRTYGPFDSHIFQSLHQARTLAPPLRELGLRPEQTAIIRGAFCPDEFPFRPTNHIPGEAFVVGRLSRSDPSKYPANLWRTLRSVPYRPLEARVMGWSNRVEQKLGPAPSWAQTLPPGSVPSGEFLQSLHACVPLSGGAQENWPRVGLEAMATGVPVVAPAQWGWLEMFEHGQTGILVQDETDVAYELARLARDETWRIELIERARERVEQDYRDPSHWFQLWTKSLFG